MIFFLEMLLKVVCLGVKKYFRSKWNIFEAILVVSSFVELGLMDHANFCRGGGSTQSHVATTLRILRLVSRIEIPSFVYVGECLHVYMPTRVCPSMHVCAYTCARLRVCVYVCVCHNEKKCQTNGKHDKRHRRYFK